MSWFAGNLKMQSQTTVILLVAVGAFLIAVACALFPPVAGIISLSVIAGMIVTVMVLHRFHWGIYILMVMSIFMFYVGRIINTDLPFGIALDALSVLMLISLIVRTGFRLDRTVLTHPITYAFLVLFFYQLLEVFNPEGPFVAWAASLRNIVYFALYIVFFHAVLTHKQLQKMTWIWIGLALLVAGYGIYQQLFGLTDFELRWIHKTPERYGIYFVWGMMRKFSFLSDPSSYGIFMAFGGLTCMVLAIMLPGWRSRVCWGSMTCVLFIAMSFSGTRSATAMVVAGLCFFALLTIRSKRTVIAMCLLAGLAAVILFGPFHGWQVNRIRSTFSLTEDPSMGVRFNKRLHYQHYVRTHPIGAGVFTTAYNGLAYAPKHPLAGFDPDSGYLETALEQGWIGLILLLAFVFVAIRCGINGYFSIQDRNERVLLLAYLVPFFALTIAHFAQNAMFAKPSNLLFILSLAVIARIPKLDMNQM